MNLNLTDEQAATLLKLNDIIDGDRCFLSPRIQTLKAIRAQIRPEPMREPLVSRLRKKSTDPDFAEVCCLP
jgi:hypothetical protein